MARDLYLYVVGTDEYSTVLHPADRWTVPVTELRAQPWARRWWGHDAATELLLRYNGGELAQGHHPWVSPTFTALHYPNPYQWLDAHWTEPPTLTGSASIAFDQIPAGRGDQRQVVLAAQHLNDALSGVVAPKRPLPDLAAIKDPQVLHLVAAAYGARWEDDGPISWPEGSDAHFDWVDGFDLAAEADRRWPGWSTPNIPQVGDIVHARNVAVTGYIGVITSVDDIPTGRFTVEKAPGVIWEDSELPDQGRSGWNVIAPRVVETARTWLASHPAGSRPNRWLRKLYLGEAGQLSYSDRRRLDQFDQAAGHLSWVGRKTIALWVAHDDYDMMPDLLDYAADLGAQPTLTQSDPTPTPALPGPGLA
jgi:hypothetical protein